MKLRRKEIRLHPLRYIGQNSYFITFCCADRRPLFANPEMAAWLTERLRERSIAHHFAVHAYCVMPDHVHVLVFGLDPRSDLVEFMADLKHRTTHAYRQQTGGLLWQKRFYDRILRNDESVDAVAGYIWMNPVRKGLCAAPQDYPHSGSFVIDWKKGFLPASEWLPEWKKKKAAARQAVG
jgi:putative transposase